MASDSRARDRGARPPTKGRSCAARSVCGLDESAEALAAARVAAALARCVDAPLMLVHAIPAVSANDGWVMLGPLPQDALRDGQERARQAGDALLARVTGRLHLADETQTLLPVGDAGTRCSARPLRQAPRRWSSGRADTDACIVPCSARSRAGSRRARRARW
jgi:hypothetical protein